MTVTNAGGLGATDAYVEAFFSDPSAGDDAGHGDARGSRLPQHRRLQRCIDLVPVDPARVGSRGTRPLRAGSLSVVPFDSYVDPTIFDVVDDRHVAQRNVHVVDGECPGLELRVRRPSTPRRRHHLVIRAEEVGTAALRHVAAALQCNVAAAGGQPLGAIGVSWGREQVLRGEERLSALHAEASSLCEGSGVMVASKGRAPTKGSFEAASTRPVKPAGRCSTSA